MSGRGRLGHHHAERREPSAERPPICWRRQFPGKATSVPEVREWARDLLAGRLATPVLDDALLLLSEIVTNAIAHSDSGRTPEERVTVRVIRVSGGVHVEVTDAGSATTAPAVRVPGPEDEGGRGLWLVDLLATAWGTRRGYGRGTVWFRLTERVPREP
ncbi:ATP-binding protein [Microtetraspora sp. NBRC 13810]|uniref:ATP-binding protein n=1 Tax=Microtetraspora sp. NBRC 13810 TaxID=3030990 RepID=UPI0024A119B1|nr:ATP-binding protein [Microtetraspora sp. NBRC 13810]GLW05212.1 ATP-binding protein [Microtetraspora sp. NBRC 13810]